MSVCPIHQTPWKLVPAGISKKTGKQYNSFWSCQVQGCPQRPGPDFVAPQTAQPSFVAPAPSQTPPASMELVAAIHELAAAIKYHAEVMAQVKAGGF